MTMTSILIVVAVFGTVVAWVAFFVFKQKDRAEIINRLVHIEAELAQLRGKGGDIQ